jgi:gamma-glutamyl hydrolase
MKSRKNRPIKIGIVTAPMPVAQLGKAESYLERDYIDWVELSGANAVVIPYNTENLAAFLTRVHGVVLVGGAIENRLTHDHRQYATLIDAVRRVFEHAVAENDQRNYFPVWGTCLGFYLLAMMGEHVKSGFFRRDRIQPEHKFRQAPLVFTGKSRLRAFFPRALQAHMARAPAATHKHEYGFDMRSPHERRMLKYLNVASTDVSDGGNEFMNMFEYKNYPFYGSQWHPEKPMGNVAVAVSLRLSEFLKSECAKNKRAVPLWGASFQTHSFKSTETVLIK